MKKKTYRAGKTGLVFIDNKPYQMVKGDYYPLIPTSDTEELVKAGVLVDPKPPRKRTTKKKA